MAHKARDTIYGSLSIGVPIVLWIFIDDSLLWKLALAVLLASAAGFAGIYRYMARLDFATHLLPETTKDGKPFNVDSLPLSGVERQLLGIQEIAHPERIRRVLQKRRTIFESIAMGMGICALIAFITLIGVFAD